MTKRPAEETEEVAAKYAKLDDTLRNDLEKVQGELNKLEQGCREEQIEVQCKYDAMKKKHFDARGALVKKIPNFWRDVLINFGQPAGLINPAEIEVLDYLEDVILEDNLDRKGSHKFTFTFKENPFFKQTTIVKSVLIKDEENVQIDVTPITFTKNPLENLLADEQPTASFLHWLQSKDEDGEDDFGSTFREHVWEEAVGVYNPEDQGDENEDDEEGDEEDDEDYDEDDEEGEEAQGDDVEEEVQGDDGEEEVQGEDSDEV